MVRGLRALGNITLVGLILLIVLGYLGFWHPVGDAFAVFRIPLALATVGLILLVRMPFWVRIAGLALPVVALLMRAAMLLPGAQAGSFTVYQKNLLYLPRDRAPLIADILAARPDFVTLQEVSHANRPILEALRADLPTQHFCPFAAVGGVAVLSRYPPVSGSRRCVPGGGLAAMQVLTDQGAVWVVGLHLHWPWPHQQAAHVDRLLPGLQAMQGPKIIAGDFNAVAWSYTLRRLASATGTGRAGPLATSFTLPVVPMRIGIDHVLAHPGQPGQVQPRPRLGSDHNGLLARVNPGG